MSEDNSMDLGELLLDQKTVNIDFPGYDDLVFSINFLGKNELVKLRKQSIRNTFDRRTHAPIEELDETKFIDLYSKAVLKGWTGFKWKYVKEFLLIDTSSLDPEGEMPYNTKNARVLVENSTLFSDWLSDVVSDLENFTKDN